MKPEIPTAIIQPEIVTKIAGGIESNLVSGNSPETKLGQVEKVEQRSEMGAVSSDVGLTTTIPQPVKADDNVVKDTTLIGAPLIAADDDLIEKEWVDKAKKIVTETQNDPYNREEQITKLQVDYLKKRYGKEIKTLGK
ncbi:MAG: hypothetical protein WCP11_01065 [Candidatus Saccharibacteria bacterium]